MCVCLLVFWQFLCDALLTLLDENLRRRQLKSIFNLFWMLMTGRRNDFYNRACVSASVLQSQWASSSSSFLHHQLYGGPPSMERSPQHSVGAANTDPSRPFVCQVCLKAFKRKDHLGVHSQVHTGNKPYLCRVCGWRFAQQSHLNNHLTKHSNERAYPCLQCSKRFKRKDSLKQHAKKCVAPGVSLSRYYF